MDKPLIVSCIFGTQLKYVHLAPDNKNSYFFTNNKDLEREITSKGWNYVYVNMPLTTDEVISSVQAKYIKFLKFLDDFPEFQKYKIIIYFDHKEKVTLNVLNELQSLIHNSMDKSLIIRHTPSLKTNIYEEVAMAMGQSRYRKNMDITKKFLKEILATGEYQSNVRICNTGLLIYINRADIKDLTDIVYQKCVEHQQPECQIYWNIYAQKYKDKIKEIKWTDVANLYREDPKA